MKIYYAKSTNGFYHEGWATPPDDAIEISQEKYDSLSSQLAEVGYVLSSDNNGNPIVVTADSLLTKEEKLAQQVAALKAQASQLLKENDYRWSNAIKLEQYSKEKKQAIIDYYSALIKVINGESNALPTLKDVK